MYFLQKRFDHAAHMHATPRANENNQGMYRGKQASGILWALYGLVHLV